MARRRRSLAARHAHAAAPPARPPAPPKQLLRADRAYLREVELAGPQRVLNMPNGWQGLAISDGERKALSP